MRMKMAITSSSYDPATEQEMWPLGTMLVKMAARRPVDIFVFNFAREPGMHVRSRSHIQYKRVLRTCRSPTESWDEHDTNVADIDCDVDCY